MVIDADLLTRLFHDADMFDSPDDFQAAGFEVLDRSGKIMVGSHSAVPGYLFKKYDDSVGLRAQLENYARRLEGARRLRGFISKQHLQHVVVPQKQIYELPSKFASKKNPSHVLVVERLNVLDSRASKQYYRNIPEAVLRELCAVLLAFRGLDSSLKNVPFTGEGRVAFIDTEHWDRRAGRSGKPELAHIRGYLSSSRLKRANEIFEELGA